MAVSGVLQARRGRGRPTRRRRPHADHDADMPRGKIGDLEISRLLLGGNLLTHYTHSRDLTYVYSLAKHYNTRREDPGDAGRGRRDTASIRVVVH